MDQAIEVLEGVMVDAGSSQRTAGAGALQGIRIHKSDSMLVMDFCGHEIQRIPRPDRHSVLAKTPSGCGTAR
jgi:hypothetical protein